MEGGDTTMPEENRSMTQQDYELPNMEAEAPKAAAPRPAHRRRKKNGLRRVLSFPRMMFVFLVSALCIVLLYSNMQLTRLTKNIAEQQTALANAQSEYVALKAKQEQTLSIGYVEQYAQDELGMVKLDPSQVKYIEMTKPELTEVSGSATLGDAVANLMRSFTAVLEYLR